MAVPVLLPDESKEGNLLKALYEHRILMLHNSYLVKRVTIDIEEREVVPDADWLASYIPRYKRMIELAEELQPILGDEAVEKYQRLARNGIATIQSAVEASRKGDLTEVKAAAIQRGSTCAECHSRRNHSWDKLKEGEFGVRSDLFQVPIDVWSLPDDKELSQRLADHLHALLVAIGASE